MQLRFPHNPNEICSTRLRSRNAQVYGILFSLSQVMLLNKSLHVLAKVAIETTDHPHCSNMPMQRWIFVPPFSHVKLPEFVELLAYLLQCYPSYDYSSGIQGSGPKEFWVANLPPKMSGHVEGFETEWTEDGYALFLKKTSPNPNHHQLRVTVATENLSDLLFQACIVGFRWKCKSQKYVYFLSSRIFITPWKMNEYP